MQYKLTMPRLQSFILELSRRNIKDVYYYFIENAQDVELDNGDGVKGIKKLIQITALLRAESKGWLIEHSYIIASGYDTDIEVLTKSLEDAEADIQNKLSDFSLREGLLE